MALEFIKDDKTIITHPLIKIEEGKYIALVNDSLNAFPPNAPIRLVTVDDQKPSEIISSIAVGKGEDLYFQAEEMAVTQFTVDKYMVGGCKDLTPICVDRYLAFEWLSTVNENHYLHVRNDNIDSDIVSIRPLPKNGNGNRLYFQAVERLSQNYLLGNIDVSMIKGEYIIPMAQRSQEHSQGYFRTPDIIDNYTYGSYGLYVNMQVQFETQSIYDNMHVLHFKNLPEGTDNVICEYNFTTSLGKKEWRIAEYALSLNYINHTHGLSVFTNNMPTGKYICRILPKKGNDIIRVSDPRFKQDEKGYCYININVTKQEEQYGQSFTNQKRNLKFEVVKPFRLIKPDPWGNQRSVTDRKHNKIESDFNLFNQNIKTTLPPADVTDAKGETTVESLVTEQHFNKRRHLVEDVDSGGDSMKRLPNSQGQNLCEEDADGVQSQHEYDLQSRCIASKAAAYGVIRSSFERQNELLIETRVYPNASCEIIAYNQDGAVIWTKGRAANKNNPNDTEFVHPDKMNRARVTFHPKSHDQKATGRKITKQSFHPRSGVLTRQEDEEGSAQIWETKDKKSVDAFVGNITSYTDLAGQVIEYDLNYNKQIVVELGDISNVKNKLRGVMDNVDTQPPARNLRRMLDEAGHETDILDDGAHLTTRMRYNKEDYCKEYYFIGHDGHVYQATNTDYDSLHRIHQLYDTKILIEIGYDTKSNRRYAKASMLDKAFNQEPFHRESWYDYSPAGRVRFRDCVLEACKIQISNTQGMEVTHKDGRVDEQKTMNSDGKFCRIKPLYNNDNVLYSIVTHTEGEVPKAEYRETDEASRVYKRSVVEKNKQVVETFTLDIDGSILSQKTETSTRDEKDKKKWDVVIVNRTIDSKSDLATEEKVVTTLKNVVNGVDVVVTDKVITNNHATDKFDCDNVTTTRIEAKFDPDDSDKTKDLRIEDYANQVKQATVISRTDANGAVTGIGQKAPVSDKEFPDGYRHFVVNSEQSYLLKETKDGHNYYFYAQKRPGKTTLMAYFGDLPDDAAKLHATYVPKVVNIDINHQKLSPNFPPLYPGKCVADGIKTYREIAEALNYTGYAEAIAWANNADVDSVPAANYEIRLPSLFSEVPETAQNGSLPAIEMLLGSMYPALAMPKITLHPPKVNWATIALEVAVGAAVMAVTGGALSGALINGLGSVIGNAFASGLAYGLAGIASSAASQSVGIVAGQQQGYDVKAMVTQGITSAASAGMSTALGAPTTTTSSIPSFTMGNVAMNVASAEAVAIAQQGVMMVTGLQSKPDWKGFATAAFNGVAGSGSKATFGEGIVASGVYTAVTVSGDELIRTHHVDATVISASAVGSMLGSYAAQKALPYVQSQQLDHREQQQAFAQHRPQQQAMSTPSAAQRPVTKPKTTPQTKPNGNPSTQSNKNATSSQDNWAADEYARTHSGYASNRAAFWNTRLQQTQNNSPAASTTFMQKMSDEFDHLNTAEKIALGAVGAVGVAAATVFLLPEAAASAVLATLSTAGTASMAALGVPASEMLIVDAATSAGLGMALTGGVGGYSAYKGATLFAESGVESAEVSGTLGVESLAKLPEKTARFTELVSGATKTETRSLLKSDELNLPAGQVKKLLEILGSGRMDSITLKLMPNGEVRLAAERAGYSSGYQRMSFEIDQLGITNKVVQTAFDDANKLVPQRPGEFKNNLYDVKKWTK